MSDLSLQRVGGGLNEGSDHAMGPGCMRSSPVTGASNVELKLQEWISSVSRNHRKSSVDCVKIPGES